MTCILTSRLDHNTQTFFDTLRQEHFPKELNFLSSHLTLFHKLPDHLEVHQYLESIDHRPITARVDRIENIGRGVAYFINSPELQAIQKQLRTNFEKHLTPQDLQRFRPHITIQNKVTPEAARALLFTLREDFQPFEIILNGLDLWHYLHGPWQHYRFFQFNEINH